MKKKKKETLPEVDIRQIWLGDKDDMIQMVAITRA